jgi:Outer membrane protein beta-barrel domain
LIFFLGLLIQSASAQWFDQGWNFELGYGVTNQEITNPDSTKAVYEGYGGHALVAYPLFQNENFSFGPHFKYFYSELKNNANNDTLSEESRYYGIAPGLELKVSHFFVGYNFKYQWLSVEMSGTVNSKITSRFSSPELYVGVEFPWQSWALRIYYLRSEGEIPAQDSGLTGTSPWAEENVFLAIRYRFGAASSSRPAYEQPRYETPKTTEPSEPYTGPRLPRRSFRVTPSGNSYLND